MQKLNSSSYLGSTIFWKNCSKNNSQINCKYFEAKKTLGKDLKQSQINLFNENKVKVFRNLNKIKLRKKEIIRQGNLG